MSRARRIKKGDASGRRFDRIFSKRCRTDPTYLTGQLHCQAPVKYSRCRVCAGRHHSPSFMWERAESRVRRFSPDVNPVGSLATSGPSTT